VSGHASNVGELARESVEFPPFGPRLLNKRRGFFYAFIFIFLLCRRALARDCGVSVSRDFTDLPPLSGCSPEQARAYTRHYSIGLIKILNNQPNRSFESLCIVFH
jgi:hypothetical protein